MKQLSFETINGDRSIVIIGSGMGGGTLAVLLARAGYHPVVIEAGDEREWSIADEPATGRPFGIAKNRAIEIGGGTNLWHGVTAPLDEEDFQDSRPERHPGWPITRDTLVPYWAAAATFLGFREPTRLELGHWPAELSAHATDLGVDFTRVTPKLFRVLHKPTRLKPILLELERKRQLTLLRGCRARRLEWSQDGTLAEAVIVNRGGELHRLVASQIVIAAGALESPVVLLNSPGGEPGGRYNRMGHVGRYLGDHPMAFVGKVRVQQPRRAPLYSDMSDGMGNRVRIGLRPKDIPTFGNSNLYLRPSFGERSNDVEDKILLSMVALRRPSSVRIKDLATILAHPRVAYRAVANRFALPVRYRHADLFFVTEQGSERISRVQLRAAPAADGLREGGYHWHVPDGDLRRLDVMFKEVIAPSLQTGGLTLTAAPTIEHWREHFTSAAHHLGTMRMSATGENGVVSSDLRLHAANNVWVCDGSVFPSVGNANPSLTICALAHRLFDHLQPLLRATDTRTDVQAIVDTPGGLPRALLTGATGFIGRTIAKRAAGRLSVLSGVRADAPARQAPGRVRIDYADERSVSAAVADCDVVIHAAYDPNQPMREGEFAGRLVDAGMRAGIRSFVFFGTYSTYDSLRDRVDEASPNSSLRLPYIVGKQGLESSLRTLSEKYPEAKILMLQPTIVTGAGGSWNRFFDHAAESLAVVLPHGGAAPLNAVDVDVVAEAAVRAALGTTGLSAGFHKFLLNGSAASSWADRIAASAKAQPPRIARAGRGLLAESLVMNLLLCLKYTGGRRWHYPRLGVAPQSDGKMPAQALTLRGLDRLTVAGWAVVDAAAARRAGLID
ncbi:GMC oxidoreductase [Roseateles sp. LKC17W]|uniref:GMC oxidoreductase n=1 Tax=Pelomonas margarita TaxID=3299031 RepID=A0ABW7FK39_9BURK